MLREGFGRASYAKRQILLPPKAGFYNPPKPTPLSSRPCPSWKNPRGNKGKCQYRLSRSTTMRTPDILDRPQIGSRWQKFDNKKADKRGEEQGNREPQNAVIPSFVGDSPRRRKDKSRP